jgi:2'-5' RNA ligase
MRIFIALDIPQQIRATIAEYRERAWQLAPEARWARIEGLHVTLKFIGEVTDEVVQQMKAELAGVKARPFEVKFEGVGFFPNEKGARIFWVGVNGGEALPRLATSVDAALAATGIKREVKDYHPHLTLARASSHPLRELRPLLHQPLPQFGSMTAREFFMFQSQPQRGGSKYTKLERFGLE